MAVTPILETDTMNQGRIKINQILEQSNSSIQTVEGYNQVLQQGITEAKQIATGAGAEAVQIATDATASIKATANQANANSQTAINRANDAVSTANQNKQEFDQLRNDFDDLVAEAGDSNPEIVQARTDTTGVKQTTLANRLTVDFADRMTKADGIELFSGQTNVKKMMDFAGKTAGNTATNPHQAYSDFTAKSLKKPSDSWNEVAQTDYNKLASRDDRGVSTGSSASGVIPQQLYKLNAVEAVKSLAPQLFEGLSAEESVQFVKNNFVSLVLTFRGKASSPNNKNLKLSTYLESTDSWTTQGQESATEYTDLMVQINDANFIDSNGFVYVISYSDMTNGVTASSIDVDYVGVAVEVSINALDILDKGGFAKDSEVAGKSEFDEHISDTQNPHSVTKAQVGLGNVPNYATATDAEALTGTATNKLITPKNLQTFYEDRQKISVARFGLSDLDSTSASKFTEASWRYRRTGNQVEFFGRFNFKVAGDSFSTIHTLPVGFRLSADFDDTSWNVPLSAAKFSSLSTYLAAGFVERMGTNFLKVASSATGNVYFYGRWYTDDPFPLG